MDGTFIMKTKRGRGKAKSAILERYLRTWLSQMGQTYNDGLVFIDGFSGPGIYRPEHGPDEHGCPVLTYNSIADMSFLYSFKSKIYLIFVERDQRSAAELTRTLQTLEITKEDSARQRVEFSVIYGEMADVLDNILDNPLFTAMPMLVFMEVFGTRAISMMYVKKLMNRNTTGSRPTELFIPIMDALAHPFISTAGQANNINILMGRDNWHYLTQVDRYNYTPAERREHFINLYLRNLKDETGNQAITMKFGMSRESNQIVYQFVFITYTMVGIQRFKESMWRNIPCPHEMYFSEWVEYKPVGLEANGVASDVLVIRKSKSTIADDLADRIKKRFAGRQISGQEVADYIWVETPYICNVKNELKNRLREFEEAAKGRRVRAFDKIKYSFP